MAASPAEIRVVVSGEQWLVAEAVRAALTTRDIDAWMLRWPGDTPAAPRPRSRGQAARSPDVGLLISDLDRWGRLRTAGVVLGRVPTRWVVITGAPRGPIWGAMLEGGARTVMSSEAGLDEIARVLRSVAHDDVVMPEAEQTQLRSAWQAAQEERRQVGERLRTLTPREHEVLRLLYAGESVSLIAERFDVSPATVRSQVKSVLRKLDVNNQLGAVAALGQLLRLGDRDPVVLA